ncbi:MAG: TlyA family RNA methyltransferase, partial [bacterium]|nr:TlyA family RNA methyltransferase [bacterium]
LAWKLRSDPRVVSMEKTNIRYILPEHLDDVIEFASIDVAFISLTKVLGAVQGVLAPNGEVVALIKPQFEAGREQVGKKGVVRDKNVHIEVIQMIIDFAKSLGFSILRLDYSPIKGPEGNIEYLLHIRNGEVSEGVIEHEEIVEIVQKAHGEL